MRALAGRRGRLVVTRASYRGIERVDNLLVTAVLDGDNDPLPTPAVGCPARVACAGRSVRRLDLPEASGAPGCDRYGAVFIDQAAVSDQDQARFDQMLRQLDHYLADQVLIMRRKEARLNAQIEELEKRRSRTHGVQAGDAMNAQLESVAQGARSCRAADRATSRREATTSIAQWRERLFARRYSRPDVTRVLDVQFEIAGTRMLKLLHTADLHLGLESAQFEPDARRRLARARLDVANTILSVAEQYAVDAVLWAGDIFDTPEPGEDWWRGFAKVLTSRARLEPARSCSCPATTIP